MVQVVRMIGDGCFPAGALVAVHTPVGLQPRPIEQLRAEESVMTASGPMRVVAVERCDAPPAPGAAIRLLAGAFGPGQPGQDLLVTPEQLLFIRDSALPEGALAPAGALVNGRGVQRMARPEGLAWFAIALESHGMPLVCGVPAGSLREAGSPLSARLLPPGPALFALRGRLTRIALAESPPPAAPAPAPLPAPMVAPPVADDAPALRLLADGQHAPTLPAAEAGNWRFTIPAGAGALRLVSPVGQPPGADADGRRFGVAIQAMLLDGIPLDLAGPAIGPGFHALETREHHRWRWTDGNAELLLPAARTPRRLEITISDWHLLLRR